MMLHGGIKAYFGRSVWRSLEQKGGDVTLWYKIFQFKCQACMGLNQSKLVKFSIAYFLCDGYGENGEFRGKSANLWEQSEFE